jgi:hypothetical protein
MNLIFGKLMFSMNLKTDLTPLPKLTFTLLILSRMSRIWKNLMKKRREPPPAPVTASEIAYEPRATDTVKTGTAVLFKGANIYGK